MSDEIVNKYKYEIEYESFWKFLLGICSTAFLIGACLRLGWSFIENFKFAINFLFK